MANAPFTPAELEAAAAAVHQAYLDTCARLGWPVKPANQVPYDELSEESKELDRASVRAVLPLHAARVREQVAEHLRTVAAGRREYITKLSTSKLEQTLDVNEVIDGQATMLETAASLAEGDTDPLYALLPSWLWTPEMHAALDGARAHATTPGDDHA